jgi:hypothetical protein
MHTQYFKNLGTNPLVKPLNELMELNIKTIQRLTASITPVEFLNARKPEELLHKNMNAFINNTQTVLDYVQDVFQIFEHNLLDSTHQVVEQTKAAVRPVTQAVSSKAAIVKKSKPVIRSGASKLNETKKNVSAKSKSPVMKKSASSIKATKVSASKPTNVHSVNKSGAIKHTAKKPTSSLKEVSKNTMKESSDLKNASSNISKPMIQLGTDSKNDKLK